MKKIIIDTDPGVDDAVAIMLSRHSSELDILAIATVAGNSTIENTTSNAQYLKNLLKLDCPIFSGASSSLSGPFTTANVHGANGLAGIDHRTTPNLTSDASEQIIKLVHDNPGEISILCLAPLTNIAKAIKMDPELPKFIKEFVVMGGTYISHGNQSVVAEFNFGLDPEAAKIVFESSTPKTMIPLDICYQTPMLESDLDKFKSSYLYDTLKSIITPYIKALRSFEGVEGAIIYDALATYYLINPKSFETKNLEVHIETKGELTRGMSVVDRRPWGTQNPNTIITTKLDREIFISDMVKHFTV